MVTELPKWSSQNMNQSHGKMQKKFLKQLEVKAVSEVHQNKKIKTKVIFHL